MDGRVDRVTMADVGARAGVTARTVSNVLSGNVPVRPATRERVMRAVEELGYRMNTSARGLRTGRTGAITLAIPDLGIDYFSELARCVMVESRRHGWTVVVQQTGAVREVELDILAGVDRQHSDGLIFQPHALGPGDERLLAGNDRLVVLGDRIWNGPVDHVGMANTEGAEAVVAYLVGRGYRRIAAIGVNPKVSTTSAASLRYAGYVSALQKAGREVLPELVEVAEEWHRRDGAAAMGHLLDLPEPPDAVFCFNDDLAIGALHVAAARGLSVPADVAVAGFDNVPAAQFSVPALTTLDPSVPQIAKYAVDLLAARVEGRGNGPREIVTEYSLVVRRSA